ncbi:MAG: pyridoxamine 5'-phosphate oxidase family protein [Cyclobacteriaceae bacterium]|nr:pyridoxamine 5'-phosphate oxidase family protein [Cyclobacteriaceae bacterium]UYN86282.1 MAG: pyridoxamine 5'-phosphate oxidase family protein [Cyclobacteriaceae bacterium]
MSEFSKTEKTTLTRLPKRGTYEKQTIYTILDEALFCTLAFVKDNEPFQIPTGFCRMGDKLYIHGSVGSHYMRELADKKLPVCISVTLMDGIVLARSAFHHSVNYRSVIIFSKAERVNHDDEIYKALEIFTDKMQPGRWADIRQPNESEWKKTMVLAFAIEEASAKIRAGGPKDDEEDYDLDIWAGVVPLETKRTAPVADPVLKPGIALPDYLR